MRAALLMGMVGSATIPHDDGPIGLTGSKYQLGLVVTDTLCITNRSARSDEDYTLLNQYLKTTNAEQRVDALLPEIASRFDSLLCPPRSHPGTWRPLRSTVDPRTHLRLRFVESHRVLILASPTCSHSVSRVGCGNVLCLTMVFGKKCQGNLTIRSLDFSVKLTIFAEESKRFLCFNQKWKLVGSKRFRGEMCQFYENMVQNGYNRFRSVVDETRFMGFNRRGKPLRGTATPHNPKCLNFIKLDQKFDILSHNMRMASGTYNESTDPVLRRVAYGKKRSPERRTAPRIRHKNHHRKFVNYP
ncbi:hypothetical protein J6590_029473 [Homalodisca vitripennis]|nr:hypothetical protein J6590_029473 [Homalodisca vitripennis]